MQNKIEFEASPSDISITNGEFVYAELKLTDQRHAGLRLILSDEDMKMLFVENVDPLYNIYRITIENITKPPTGSELLQMASTSAKLGNSKLAVEQAVKALQKLV